MITICIKLGSTLTPFLGLSMYTSSLCPVYQKWLQLHPNEARAQLHSLKAQALQYRKKGNLVKAAEYYQQVWEIARSVLFSLRVPEDNSKKFQQDIFAFVTAAIETEQCNETQELPNSHLSIISATAQQLSALLPLYASEPNLLSTIRHLKSWISNSRNIQRNARLH